MWCEFLFIWGKYVIDTVDFTIVSHVFRSKWTEENCIFFKFCSCLKQCDFGLTKNFVNFWVLIWYELDHWTLNSIRNFVSFTFLVCLNLKKNWTKFVTQFGNSDFDIIRIWRISLCSNVHFNGVLLMDYEIDHESIPNHIARISTSRFDFWAEIRTNSRTYCLSFCLCNPECSGGNFCT